MNYFSIWKRSQYILLPLVLNNGLFILQLLNVTEAMELELLGKSVALSTKTMAIILIECCNHWSNCRATWLWWMWKLYEHTWFFFSVNFIYLRSKGIDKGHVDDIPSLVIE